MVLAEGVAIRQGGAWLADQLMLLGDCPGKATHSATNCRRYAPAADCKLGAGTIHSRIAGLYFAVGDVPPSSILAFGDELDPAVSQKTSMIHLRVRIVLDGRKLGYVPSRIPGPWLD